jgi:2-methylisocitrate lyase-like PEP mutase family enzyme
MFRCVLKGRKHEIMSKLLDMFAQARRGQGGSGMGFLGKSKTEAKPRAAAIVVELAAPDAGSAEAAVKAGADGLLFTWKGNGQRDLETIKAATEAAKASNEKIICGLHLGGDLESLSRENFDQFKEQGISFFILPLQAPARLLALHVKDVDTVVTVPMRADDIETYLLLIRHLSAFDTISAVALDFALRAEEILQYRAVRDAVRVPAMIHVEGEITESDAYTLTALGVQALIIPASDAEGQTEETLASLRDVLEKVYKDEKENTQPTKL